MKIKTIIEAILAWLAGLTATLPKAKNKFESIAIQAARRIQGGLLPTATAADAGKVPTAQEDGSYALAEAGGGGGDEIVLTYSGSPADGANIQFDGYTYEELAALLRAGKKFIIDHVDPSTRHYIYREVAYSYPTYTSIYQERISQGNTIVRTLHVRTMEFILTGDTLRAINYYYGKVSMT